jgi:hypothetical protein
MMFAIAAVLAVFGTMMVYSASAMLAHRETAGASQFTYFYKQAGFTVAGVVLMLLISRFDYRRLNNIYAVGVILLVTIAALAAVYMFPEINGAQRWIRFGGLSLQPSEMAKIALPLFLAYFLTRNETRVGEIKATVLPCLAVLGVVGGLVFFEPDLGTTLVLGAIFASIYFAAGAKLTHVAAVGGLMAAVGGIALVTAPWRMRRLAAFVDPCNPENSADAGYQVCQSLYAIGSGGIVGEGFAKGQQKLFYLPVSALGFYLFGGRRGVRADRDAECRDAFRTALVARGEGSRQGTGQVRDAARDRADHGDHRAGAFQYQCRGLAAAGKGHSAAVHLVRRVIGAGVAGRGRAFAKHIEGRRRGHTRGDSHGAKACAASKGENGA